MPSAKKSKTKTVARSAAAKAGLREKILATARALVLRDGYAALSIRKLAAQIGYAPGTIYLYFKNRDEIGREICREGFSDLYDEMKPAGEIADPEKRLAALLRAYAAFAAKNPDTYRLSFMEDPKFTEEMFRAAPLERQGGAGWLAFDLFVNAVRELRKTGKISPEADETLLAEVLWTAVHGVISLKLIFPAFPTNSSETLTDKIIEILINGIRLKAV